MKTQILKRFLQAMLVLFGVAFLLFIMVRVIPGNPVAMMMGDHADPAAVERISRELGLDRPLHEQFFIYLRSAVRFDFGTSYTLGRPVAELMAAAFPNTLKLAVCASVFAWVTGILCGIAAAAYPDSIADHLFMGVSLLGLSMPVFLIAMIFQYVFAYHLHILPISGADSWKCFILPSIALGWNAAGSVARLMRSSLIEVMGEDYIDTAYAKGRSRAGVLLFHALRNAMLPVVTMMALQFSSLVSGAVITETVFSINGIGRLAVAAISGRDIPLLQGTVLFSTLAAVLGNLLANWLYLLLDPRIAEAV